MTAKLRHTVGFTELRDGFLNYSVMVISDCYGSCIDTRVLEDRAWKTSDSRDKIIERKIQSS